MQPPARSHGTCFNDNPLNEIRKGSVDDVTDAEQLARFVVDPLGYGFESGRSNDHYRSIACKFVTAALLHVVYSPNMHDRTLQGLDAFLSSGTRTIEEIFEEMCTCEHDPTHRYGWVNDTNTPTKTHPIVAGAARSVIALPPCEQHSTMATVLAYTVHYRYRSDYTAHAQTNSEART